MCVHENYLIREKNCLYQCSFLNKILHFYQKSLSDIDRSLDWNQQLVMHACNQTLEDTVSLFFLLKLLVGSHVSKIDYLTIFVIDVEIHHLHYDCFLVILSLLSVTFCLHLVHLSSFVAFLLALVKLKNFFQRKLLLGFSRVRYAPMI